MPVVRQRVADIFEYGLILQGMQHAAEELAYPSEAGVMTPTHNIVTAGRSYAQHHLPRILHILQDICGQGLDPSLVRGRPRDSGGLREEPGLVPRHPATWRAGTRTS